MDNIINLLGLESVSTRGIESSRRADVCCIPERRMELSTEQVLLEYAWGKDERTQAQGEIKGPWWEQKGRESLC